MPGFVNVTLAQLQTQLAERYESRPFWTADQARRAINEGMRVWNVLTGYWRTSYPFATLPKDPYVPLVGGVMKAIRVKYLGASLIPTSLQALDLRFPSWRATPLTSGPRYWAPVSLTTLAIYPQDLAGGNALSVDALSPAPVLVNGGDFLNMGSEEISTLLGYALHVLTQSKGVEALKSTRPLYLSFMAAAATRNEYFAKSSFYRKLVGIDRTRFNDPARRADAESGAVAAGEERTP